MGRGPCGVSVAEHCGWAHAVCVAAPGKRPAVIERRRVKLIDAGLPTQPYEHDTRAMREDDANALIAKVRRSASNRSLEALQHMVTELTPYTVVALAIRKPPFPGLPETVATAWQSHRLLYSADGMVFQLALCRAAQKLGLEVQQYRRGDAASLAAELLGTTSDDIDEFISRTGRPTGPPWTQEHRQAFAAGIATLAPYVRRRLILEHD